MKTKKITPTGVLAVAATLALGLALGACSPQGAQGPSPAPSADAAPSAAPAEEDTKPTPPTFATGDIITADLVETLPENQAAFTLASGEIVVVDRAQRLPDVVLNEVIAVYPRRDNGMTPGQNGSTYMTVTVPKINEIARTVGRTPVLVVPSGEYDINNKLVRTYWAALFVGEPNEISTRDTNETFSANQHATAEAAVAYAEDVISRTKYDIEYDIVVIE